MLEDQIQTFQCLYANLRTVQKIWKIDWIQCWLWIYGSSEALVYFDKKRTHKFKSSFLEIQAVIDNDRSKSIRSVARNGGVSEFLIRQCMKTFSISCPVGWVCRIHWLLLCRGVRHPPMSFLDMTLNNLMVRFL